MTQYSQETSLALWMSVPLAIVAGAAALGYGSMAARFLRIRPNFGDAGVLGLLCLGIIAEMIHFVTALSSTVQVCVLVIGVVLAVVGWREGKIVAALRPLGIAGIFVVMVLQAKSLRQTESDMALYHLQTLRWYREFPIVLGLGNLHGRLSFNSTLLLIDALTDHVRVRWIPNLLFATFIWISLFIRFRTVQSLQGATEGEVRRRIEYWYLVIVLGITGLLPRLWGETWAINADIVAAYLIMYWVALSLRYADSDLASKVSLLLLTSSLAMSVKISAAPLLVLTFLTIVMSFKVAGKYVRRPSIVAGLLLIPWMARGLLLSGCALYPVRQTCAFNLPWAESPDMVYDEYISIRSWARLEWEGHFTKALHDWNWVGPWMKSNWRQPLPAFLVMGAVLGLAAFLFNSSMANSMSREIKLLCIAMGGCVAFWFLSAPDIRFGTGFLFSAATLWMSLACAAWLRNPHLYSRTMAMPATFMALGALIAMRTIYFRPEYTLFAIPKVEAYRINVGERKSIWVPANGNECWDHPLPCTPYVNAAAIAKVEVRDIWLKPASSPPPPYGFRLQSSVNAFPEERYSENSHKNLRNITRTNIEPSPVGDSVPTHR
ncbi:MAG: hypothetical protein M3N93_00150 [Acidobacteriota bacterium]|nr:hypothetical protein [Acidobacteriota bacterium]